MGVFVLQSCEVMAAASVNRPGSAQTTEKSQLILKGNHIIFPVFNELWCNNVLKQDVQIFHRMEWGQITSFHKDWVEPVVSFL